MGSKKKAPPKTQLRETLYCYVEPDNAKWAKEFGKKNFGSFSAYVNVLIATDRGAEAAKGIWSTTPGKRPSKKKKAVDKPVEKDPSQLELPIETSEDDFEVYE